MLGLDGFSSILVYVFFVSPVLSWILKPGRFSRRRAFAYAIGFLFACVATNVIMEIYSTKPNFYSALNVRRDSSMTDIKKAYRRLSIELHPDKNPSTDAAEKFNRLRVAYDVLSDADNRRKYDLHGEDVATGETALGDSIEQLISILTFYLVWALMTYLLTRGEDNDSLSWIYAGELAMFLLELNLRFARFEIPQSVFPYTTAFEIIHYMHSIFPAYMNGCRAIGGFVAPSLQSENLLLTVELLKSNRFMLTTMRELHADMQDLNPRHKKSSSTPISEIMDQAYENIPTKSKNSKSSKRSALRNRKPIKGSDSENDTTSDADSNKKDPLMNPEEQDESPGFSIPRIVWVLAFYAVIHYFQ